MNWSLAASSAAALPLAASASAPTQAAYPGGRGMLAWATTSCAGAAADGSALSIVTANADGTGRRLLSCNGVGSRWQDVAAVWSPDGNRLAVVRCSNWVFGCYSSNAIDIVDWDGRNRRSLAADATDPTWSPDGTALAFTKLAYPPGPPGSSTSELWRIDVDGTDAGPVPVAGCTHVSAPRWGQTPVGERILFGGYCAPSAAWALYSVQPNGTGLAVVRTHGAAGDTVLWDWAPDGADIVLTEANAPAHPGFPAVYRLAPVSPSGTATRLTSAPAWYGHEPVYAPDGDAIAFTGPPADEPPFSVDIWVAGAAGESPRPVTRDRWQDSSPSWQACRPGVTVSCVSAVGLPAPQFVQSFAVAPAVPRAGFPFSARLVAVDDSGARLVHATVECTARVGTPIRPLRLLASAFARGQGLCRWRVPRSARGLALRGSIAVRASGEVISRRFVDRVR